MKYLLPMALCIPIAAFAAAKDSFTLTGQWSAYFSNEVRAIEARGLSQVRTLEDWQAQRETRRQELLEMLGLSPMPERAPLRPIITGVVQHQEFTVEKLHFQASPGLYVTANFYLPRERSGRLPAVLYVCGHSRTITNGVSLGNKVGYQHHGEWFSRNGYACLIIDTLQYAEILGAHRGTYSDGQWWWNSRGYTPAGIEAWFAIRALDYLCERPEVDPARIGMTGRSGGGAYSWTVAAIDDRVKVAAPIAGMTDLRNHVLDGVVDGHCDCMFQVNNHRWDFPMIAALIAPRPLMLGNSDADRIFPLDGVLRLHQQVRRIYDLYGERDSFALLITHGDHKDTQELQVPVFRWFNRFLKGEEPLIEMAAQRLLDPAQLRVFDQLPADQRNTTAPDWFNDPHPPKYQAAELAERLRKVCFAGWPADRPTATLSRKSLKETTPATRAATYDLPLQPGITQPLYRFSRLTPTRPESLTLFILGEDAASTKLLEHLRNERFTEAESLLAAKLPEAGSPFAVFVPRGVGDPAFASQAASTRMKRRFMLLGQTLDGMRVWDIMSAIAALKRSRGSENTKITLAASGPMAVNAAFANLFEPVEKLALTDLPANPKQRPDYLGVLRVTDQVPGIGN